MPKKEKKKAGIGSIWFVWNIVESIILFIGGSLAIVAGSLGENVQGQGQPISNAVAYVISAFVILDGVLRVIMHLAYYAKDDEPTPMVIAGFEVSMGVLLILLQAKHGLFVEAAVHLVSIAMMVVGVLLLVYAIFFIARKIAKLVMPLLEILFSAVIIAVGVTIEVLYATEQTRERLGLIMIGAILIVAAIAIFVIAMITNNKAKKEKEAKEKAEEPEIVKDDEEEEPKRKQLKKKNKNEVVVAEVVDETQEEKSKPEPEDPPQIEDKKE